MPTINELRASTSLWKYSAWIASISTGTFLICKYRGLVTFLTQHRGHTIPSPALLQRMGRDFVRSVHSFAESNSIPIIHFEPGVRKDDVTAEYRRSLTALEGVVFVGIAQEKVQAFRAHKRSQGQMVGFDYSRQSVYVNHYYFYLQDQDFGPPSSRSALMLPSLSKSASTAMNEPSNS